MTETTVWRVKINSGRQHEVDWDQAKAYCRRAGVVGVGWGRPEVLADGASLEEVLAAVQAKPDWVSTGPKIIRRLALEMRDGDLVWTRDRSGGYWLGRAGAPTGMTARAKPGAGTSTTYGRASGSTARSATTRSRAQ